MSVWDLRFEPDLRECPECPEGGCDLRCVWPSGEPQRWEGDDA